MANSRFSYSLDLDVTGYKDGVDSAERSNADFVSSIKDMKQDLPSLKKELNASRKEVQALALAYSKLSKEGKQSGFGKALKRELDEVKAHTAELIDLQGDLNNELKNLSSDTRTFDTLSESIGIVGDVTSATMGIIAQFTGNEKDAQKAVVAFTTAQSALSAITKIQNALQMQSNTMLAVTKVQELAAAAAVDVKAAAEGRGIVATKAATVAQAAFNVVAKANPYVLLASAVVTVVGALTAFVTMSGKAAEEQERENRIMERAKQVNDAYYSGINSELEKLVPKYVELKTEWENLKTEAAKIQWIKDNQSEFNSLGVEINTVADAENFLVTQSDTVMQSFIKRAKAIGIAQRAAEIYRQALEDIQWLEENRDSKTLKSDELAERGFGTNNARITGHGGVLGLGHARYQVTDIEAEKKQRMKAADEAMKSLYKEMASQEKEGQQMLADVGIKEAKKTNKKIANAHSNKEAKKVIHDNSVEQAEELVKTWEQALRQADINNKPLIEKIKQKLEEAKNEVNRRKLEVGIEVKVKSSSDVLKEYEQQLNDAAKEAEAAMVLATIKGDYSNIDELTNKWEQATQALKNYNSQKDLLSKGIEISGSKSLSDALSGNFAPTLAGYENAISTLEDKLKNIDWSQMGKDGSKTFEQYVDKIQQYKAEIEQLNEKFEDAMLTPTEKVAKHFQEIETKSQEMAGAFNSLGDVTSSLGNVFNSMGNDAAAAAMQIISSTANMVAQVVPQIMKLIGAKQAEAMAEGTVSAARLQFPANLPAIASVVATILSVFAQIKSAGQFATGGVVGGHSYYGDRLMAYVNSGETILNREQTKNAVEAIGSNKLNKQVVIVGETKFRGSDLYIVYKNYEKSHNITTNKYTLYQ